MRASLVVAIMLCVQAASAQTPRTLDGHPDFGGVWYADFMTRLQRPDGFKDLVVPPERVEELKTKLKREDEVVYDPDNDFFKPSTILTVGGELRSSWLVQPLDGKLPLTALGRTAKNHASELEEKAYDNPEERPGSERCVLGFGHPPLTAVSIVIPSQIVQTPNAILVQTEDTDMGRVIHLDGAAPPGAVRTRAGHSAGRWDGDTLVVTTTHLAVDDPGGVLFRGGVVVSEGSRITERFRLLSRDELLYQFTVEDPALYDQPWLAEYSLQRLDGRVYEYACHEGNHAMVNILTAARLGRQIAPEPQPDPKKPDPKKPAK